MAEPIEFNTQRLAFRVWQERHRAAFASLNADPEVMRYFPALVSAEQTNAGIDIWRTQFDEQGFSNWAVELAQTGEFIGFIGLSVPRRQLPCSPCVEIGWRLKRSAWGHGYATEGAKECLRLGFEVLGLTEIVSFTTLTNLPSRKVMERIGMANAHADFEHPAVPEGHALRPHCLYKNHAGTVGGLNGLTRQVVDQPRNSRRNTLPTALLGSSALNSTTLGRL